METNYSECSGRVSFFSSKNIYLMVYIGRYILALKVRVLWTCAPESSYHLILNVFLGIASDTFVESKLEFYS